jgi:methoxymalonate biosynthesis acyl carrier protein
MSDQATAIERFITARIGEVESGQLPHDEDLLAAELIDSLAITELVSFLEAEFAIRIEDEDLTPENFRTVDSIAAFVTRKGG